MKIVLNAVSTKMGGAVTYLHHLARAIAAADTPHEFILFVSENQAASLRKTSPKIRVIATRAADQALARRYGFEQIALRRFLKRERADVLYSTASFAMFASPVPQLLLVTNALYFSETYETLFLSRLSFLRRHEHRFRRWLIVRGVRASDVVIVPTRAMLHDLQRYSDVGPERVVISPFGVDSPFAALAEKRTVGDSLASGPDRTIRLAYVSHYYDYKNLITLLKALPLLNRKANGRTYLLLATGDPRSDFAKSETTWEEDSALASHPEISPWVKFVGPLGSEAIDQLYRSADIFVFPSLIESFGFPMAEAMAHGLPIVAADTPVNREICGEAAVYFSPRDPEDLCLQVEQVASDDSLRARLSTDALQRASARFTSKDHFSRILEILERLSKR